MPFRVKAIKPPRDTLNPRRYEAALKRAERKAGGEVKKDFEGIWRTWHHKPEAALIIRNDGASVRITVFVRDYTGIFHWVNKGTRAHIIRPKNGGRLFFRTPFTPKSRPLSLQAGSGRRGNNPVYADVVRHPGIKARRFDLIIARKHAMTLARYVREEIERLRYG